MSKLTFEQVCNLVLEGRPPKIRRHLEGTVEEREEKFLASLKDEFAPVYRKAMEILKHLEPGQGLTPNELYMDIYREPDADLIDPHTERPVLQRTQFHKLLAAIKQHVGNIDFNVHTGKYGMAEEEPSIEGIRDGNPKDAPTIEDMNDLDADVDDDDLSSVKGALDDAKSSDDWSDNDHY